MERLSRLPALESVCSRQLFACRASPLTAIRRRPLHTTPPQPATVESVTASGPPPPAPVASAEAANSRIERRRKQAELLQRGQDLRAAAAADGKSKPPIGQKRFWKDVHVKRVEEGWQVLLDSRPLRTPSKEILITPLTKPHLATAIALEWDLLVSAQQALRHHLIPLTSLVSRALDLQAEDARSPDGQGEIRQNIVKTVMRYLDTDSLLCWAPEPAPHEVRPGSESLRSLQRRTAEEVIGLLTTRVWPGVEIVPVLEENTILPRPQPPMTREIIQGWVSELPAFELAGLERGVLAGKSLLGAARLIVEWSEEMKHLREGKEGERWGIEDAARAADLETAWQTSMWGEVEDTHDVNKEDLRRQLGSVVLLVSGEEGPRK